MSFIQKQLTSVIVVSSVIFCSVSASADDMLTPGPGLFSGESGEFSLTTLLDRKQTKAHKGRKQGEDSISQVRSSALAPYSVERIDKTETANFKTYQEWRTLRDAAPELYNDFELYLDYKVFLETQKKN